jgi:hypothetical protein
MLLLSNQSHQWSYGWRIGIAMFLLVSGIFCIGIGFILLDINEKISNAQKEISKTMELDNTTQILSYLKKLELGTGGSSFLAVGIALTLGSYPFIESIMVLKRKISEDLLVITPILLRSRNYIEDVIQEYSEYLNLAITRPTLQARINAINNMLIIRNNLSTEYANRTENDILFLQLKRPDLYADILRLIQSNRVLMNSNQFQHMQPGFEREHLESWISNVQTLLPLLRSINCEILALQI